jgi:hypothetical protein
MLELRRHQRSCRIPRPQGPALKLQTRSLPARRLHSKVLDSHTPNGAPFFFVNPALYEIVTSDGDVLQV